MLIFLRSGCFPDVVIFTDLRINFSVKISISANISDIALCKKMKTNDPFDFSKTCAIVNETGKTVKFHKKEKIWRLRFSTMF